MYIYHPPITENKNTANHKKKFFNLLISISETAVTGKNNSLLVINMTCRSSALTIKILDQAQTNADAIQKIIYTG
jgi:hypothetical protein